MTQAAKDWTASRWAEWAAETFLKWKVDADFDCGCTSWHTSLDITPMRSVCSGCGLALDTFNPLHDANHLMPVLDEIERRAVGKENISAPWTWECWKDEHGKNVYGCGLHHVRGQTAEVWSPQSSTRNLAVLLAAKELQEQETR